MVSDSAADNFGPPNVADTLSRAIDCIGRLGDDYSRPSSLLADLLDRLTQGCFHLAVLGQFKRGKSTLLNALLGEKVLPTAVVPLTAIPTFIRHGQTLQATAIFEDDREPEKSGTGGTDEVNAFLSKFVTEDGNPKNRMGVLQVEITHPSPILDSGVVLIDTPGIGSTFKHNTEATLNFLPQCDAALFLVSADPPLTEVEVEFLKHARKKISRIFFLLNKVDYLSQEDRQIALDFLRTALIEHAGIEPNVSILSISAGQGLTARIENDSRLWEKSGLPEVEHRLIKFLANEKSETLNEAVSRKAVDVIANVVMRLQLAIRSLQMPIEDLQHRLDVFEQKIDEVKRQRESASDMLAGDEKRMLAYLEDKSDHLRGKARKHLESALRSSLTNGTYEDEITESDAQTILDEAIPSYFEHQNGAMADLIGKEMTHVLSGHQEKAEQIIESIRKTAADLFEVAYHAPEGEGAFQIVKRPYWVTHKWSSAISPIPPSAIERLLPAKMRNHRVMKRIHDQIAALVRHNVENIRWTLYQNIDRTFRLFGSTLDDRLTATLAATHGAIRVAMQKRQEQGRLVSEDVSRIESIMTELVEIQKTLE